MTCDNARDALLETDFPIDDASELARHLETCETCARTAAVIARDIASLRTAVGRRGRSRRRVAMVAAASTLAAAAVVAAVVRFTNRAAEVPPVVNDAPQGVVSVQVPPGKTATVLQTKDPNVTVVWLSKETGGGS